MTKIITARIFVNPTGGFQSFAIPFLGEPGQRKGYAMRSFSASAIATSVSGNDGVVLALQDGEIEEALLNRAVGAGRATLFANIDAIFTEDLSVWTSICMGAVGSGLGWTSRTVQLNGFETVNAQTLLLHIQAAAEKRLMVHLEYEEMQFSDRQWTELKHRPPVVDMFFPIDT